MTEDYRGKSPSGPRPDLARVALVAGSGPVATDDLYRLLRRRLLILCLVMAGIYLFVIGQAVASRLLSGQSNELPVLYDWFLSHWSWFLGSGIRMLIAVVFAIVLWRRPPQTVFGLRVVEVILFGLLVASAVEPSIRTWDRLEDLADQPRRMQAESVGRYVYQHLLRWFCTLTLYGVFIPNTWRRCAVMVAIIGACPLVLFAVYGYWLRPIDPLLVNYFLRTMAVWVAIAAVIAVFASSRIAILRRQAAEARKLGQYVLKEKLGAGGMGEVYRAEHVLLRRPCAIKLIRPERAGDPKTLRRFEREVQVTATLTHPNTIQIFDYGHTEDGTFYYVMEYLPGLTLEELLKRDGPLPPARVIHFLRQTCAALREAHGQGLIHRDIKPGNVMICERGGVPDVAKLLDFGLVLPPVCDRDGERLTQDGSVTGTPAYLSPEQAGGQETLDARSDIYSVGAVAYFLLTGQPPFANRSGVKMLAAHLYEEPEPLSARRPSVPRDLEAVVLRCLAKNPEARFPDADSLDAALAACRREVFAAEGDGLTGRTRRGTGPGPQDGFP